MSQSRNSIEKTFLAVGLVLSCCAAAFAGDKTVTIFGTDHDFSAEDWPTFSVPTPNKECEACHLLPGPLDSTPVWNHLEATAANIASDWLYDAAETVRPVAGSITVKCLGCHQGSIADGPAVSFDGPHLDDINGQTGSLFIDGGEAFGHDLRIHHPVDIIYGAGTARLKDPNDTLNPLGGGTVYNTMLDGGLITCVTCHDQHNDRAFENLGGDTSDDPGKSHYYLVLEELCFVCHNEEDPGDGFNHHIPGRADPFGEARSVGGFVNDVNCRICHLVGGDMKNLGQSGAPNCRNCHNEISRGGMGADAEMTPGHHGGGDPERTRPYQNCAACHADPMTGMMTGAMFGSLEAPSCYSCHDYDVWNIAGNVAPTFGSPEIVGVVNDQLTGIVNEGVRFTALTNDLEGDVLTYTWSFGDGSAPLFPSASPTIDHLYTKYTNLVAGDLPYKASVAVTDGVNPPVTYEFDVIITEDPNQSVLDKWTVDPGVVGGGDEMDITIEDYDGALVITRPGKLAYGIEFQGVIFWMELWMDISGAAYWGTGDMYFGNIDRRAETMDGVIFRTDGSIETFAAGPWVDLGP